MIVKRSYAYKIRRIGLQNTVERKQCCRKNNRLHEGGTRWKMSFRTIDLITVKASTTGKVIVLWPRGAEHDGKWTLIRGVHLYYTSRQLWETSIIPGWSPTLWENNGSSLFTMLEHHPETQMSFLCQAIFFA